MSDIGTWSPWSGPPARRSPPVVATANRTRRVRVSVQREIQLEIRTLEERLANPGQEEHWGSLAAHFGADFREFGSSGRVFDAATVLAAVDGAATRPGRSGISLEGFRVEKVAPNVVLATYVSKLPAGPGWKPPSLRSSLWCKRDGKWQIVFHQGTPVPAERSGP